MNEQIKEYLSKYPPEIISLYADLRQLLLESVPFEVTETLWAKLPSYYAGESFVRLIPFKDHINIEARAAVLYKDRLTGYKMTPKGMLQIRPGQEIPCEILKQIFIGSLA